MSQMLGVISIHALRHTHRLTDILDSEISKGHVLDVPASSAAPSVVRYGPRLSLPRFYPRGVREVDEVDVLVQDILYEIWVPWLLAHRSDWHTMRTIAGDVPGDDIGTVPFDDNTVVAWFAKINERTKRSVMRV